MGGVRGAKHTLYRSQQVSIDRSIIFFLIYFILNLQFLVFACSQQAFASFPMVKCTREVSILLLTWIDIDADSF